MSKSAIKLLNTANEILAALDLTIGNPASWMNNEQARNQFKNADLLACLIIDSAANALICENVDTLDETMYDDMQQAVEGYIQSNLDTWFQADWKKHASLCDVKALLAKLLDAVEGQRLYNAIQKAHAEALQMNDGIEKAKAIIAAMGDSVEAADCASGVLIRADYNEVSYLIGCALIERAKVLKAHEEALEIDSMVDEAVFQATVFCDNANLDHVVRQHSVDSIRNQLLSLNRYPARFIVKMMISVRRLAGEARVKAKANYQAMMSRPFVTDIDHEIPF